MVNLLPRELSNARHARGRPGLAMKHECDTATKSTGRLLHGLWSMVRPCLHAECQRRRGRECNVTNDPEIGMPLQHARSLHPGGPGVQEVNGRAAVRKQETLARRGSIVHNPAASGHLVRVTKLLR